LSPLFYIINTIIQLQRGDSILPVNGKAKGNNGERILAKILSEYLGGSFVRVPNSGAFIGGKNQTRKDTLSVTQIRSSKGDIIPPDDYPNLVVECKFYKDIAYHSLAVDQNVALLDTWIKELEYDCDENDFGILCFKTNNRKW